MPLKTDTFGISRYWLSTALSELPRRPKLFKNAELSSARKAFLAGANQLTAIKNWLSRAEIVDINYSNTALTDLGKLMAAQDARAESAFTWWLFHLHLCANDESFPYREFFCLFDADSKRWWTFDDLVEELCNCQEDSSRIAEKSVKTYFEGIEQTFRPTWPIYDLGLVERRKVAGDSGKERIRRRRAIPDDLVVLYAALLFQHHFLPTQPTVEAGQLLEHGLGRSLGMRDGDVRDAFVRIHQDSRLGEFFNYSQAANLDSVQFAKSGISALKQVRTHAYQSGNVRWP